VATVSAVGRRLVEDPDAALAAAEALAGLRVERWWSVGETWTALLPGAQAPTAVARLHALFVESSV
jgi:hypothetical protein